MGVTNKSKEQSRIKELEYSDRYYYNKENDCYIIYIKHLAKNIVISGETHRGMLSAYSGEDQRSVEEICTSFNVPQAIFNEYKSVFGWTRDSMPISAEEIETNSVEDSVSALLERKKFEIAQKFNKESWTKTQADAEKWGAFEMRVLKPFESAIENIKPLPKFTSLKSKNESKNNLIIGLSDHHFGQFSNSKFLFSKTQKGWTMADTHKAIDNYALELDKLVKSRTYKFNEALVFSLGDQIHQNYDGKTTKGTVIEGWPTSIEQWENAFAAYSKLLNYISQILPLSKVISLAGNHSAFGDTVLFKALEAYFRNNAGLKFEVHDARWSLTKVGRVGIIAEHGASPYYKSKLPRAGAAREAYVQKLMWEKRKELKDCSQIIFISGDLHSFEHNEYGQFDQIVFGSLVGADQYADNQNLRSLPRQNALILEDDKLKEVVNFYLS